MERAMKIRKLTDVQKERIMNLGIDYGFEQGYSGSGFVLECGGKTTYAIVRYEEFANGAEVKIHSKLEPNMLNKKSLTKISEVTEGVKALIDAFEKANQSPRARISGDGIWRSRIS